MRWLVLFALLVCACSGESTVILSYPDIDTLPEYAFGSYYLADYHTRHIGSNESWRPDQQRGWLSLRHGDSFLLRLDGAVTYDVVGYFSVESGLLVVYNDKDLTDIVIVYKCQYFRGTFRLEHYDARRDYRVVMKFKRNVTPSNWG